MRVKPSPLITVGLAIGYMAIVAVTWIVLGLDYDTVGDSTGNVLKGIVVPVGLASVFLAGATSYLGWWKPAIREQMRAPKWLWAVPVLMLLPGVGSVLGGLGEANRTASYLLALGAGTLLVGFGEEMLTRGTGLVGLRGGFGEALSWFFSCLLFGVIHALNVFFGQSLASTAQQIGMAFMAGSVLYITRRVSGTLIVCMILHAWVDFTTFAFAGATEATSPFRLLGIGQTLAFILAIVGVVIVLRGGSRQGQPSEAVVAA